MTLLFERNTGDAEDVRMTMGTRIGWKSGCLTAAMAGAALAPHQAGASLGAPEATVAADAEQLKGSIRLTEHANYRVHEVTLPSGTVLREFATPAGSIFAVAWSGPSMPNLRQALGGYFDTYTAAAKAPHQGHHHLAVTQDKIVLQSSGRMRAFTGRAYLPQAVPAGVSVDELH